MSILITGGTGFIGAEIVRELLARGEEEIHVLHRSGNFQRLHDLVPRLHLVQVELADGARLQEVVAETRPRAIYHLGAVLTGPGEIDPQAATEANAWVISNIVATSTTWLLYIDTTKARYILCTAANSSA